MTVQFIRTADRRQEVRRDGVLLGHVWQSAGKWAWQVRGAMLVGGHRITRTGAATMLAQDYAAAHPEDA